jgi:hypothetical protein
MVVLYIYSTCWRMKLTFYERQHLTHDFTILFRPQPFWGFVWFEMLSFMLSRFLLSP